MEVDGRAIECRWWGDARASGLPIVLLHEGLGSVGLWRTFPAALSKATGRRVMAYSRFGHGASALPAAPHTTRFMHEEAALLPSILDSAGIERAILFGHSDGASIAGIAAAQSAQRVDSLILEAPHVFVEEVSIKSIERTTSAYRNGILRGLLARHHDHVDVAFDGWSNVWLDPAFLEWNLEEFLPHITCPVLLIQGEGDEYGTLRQIDAIARQVRGPVTRLVLRDCGHAPHRDQPDAVLTAAAAFLRRVD